ncbi:MAG: DUF4058 family protein [Cyanobacteria bacterium P01_F01_bin.13]
MPVIGNTTNAPYSILVSHSEQRSSADLYSFGLPETIPNFALPPSKEEQLAIPLQEIFTQVYDQARYGSRIDYQQPLTLALTSEEKMWLTSLLETYTFRILTLKRYSARSWQPI